MIKKIKLNNFPSNPIGEITSSQMELFVIETEATEETEAAVTMLIKTKNGKYQLPLEMIDDATFNAFFGIVEEEVVEEEETPVVPEPGVDEGEEETLEP